MDSPTSYPRTRRIIVLAALLTLIAGACSSPAAPTPTPFAQPPTARPDATLKVSAMKYTAEAALGGKILLRATVANTGSARREKVRFQLNDLDDNADFVRCKPACDDTSLLGIYADFDPLGPGATQDYQIELVASKIGAAHWSACIYQVGEQIYCGDATTVIR